MYTFLDDYSHINREFDFFHPKKEEYCCDECMFSHEEQSVLEALHEHSVADDNVRAFACVAAFLFGVR